MRLLLAKWLTHSFLVASYAALRYRFLVIAKPELASSVSFLSCNIDCVAFMAQNGLASSLPMPPVNADKARFWKVVRVRAQDDWNGKWPA